MKRTSCSLATTISAFAFLYDISAPSAEDSDGTRASVEASVFDAKRLVIAAA